MTLVSAGKPKTNRNILITGGCGHIGSAMISHDCMRDYNITVVDNMLTQRYCSLFDMNRKIKFIESDIKDLTKDHLQGIDAVIHMASVTNAAGSFDETDVVEKINYNNTINFMDLCGEVGCKFIFPSSTSVYGVAADEVHEDDDKFLNPQSPYAESKIKGEQYLKDSGLDYIILRLGTIFGKSSGMRFHTAINKFCYQASIGEPLTIWKENYNQYRPYLGLNDCVRSFDHFLSSDHSNEVFNVLTNNYKLTTIVEIIKKCIDVEINMVDTPLLNQYSYFVNYEKLLNSGFVVEDDIEYKIRETLHLLRNLK